MKSKDFIKIEERHAVTCKTLIENKGVCRSVLCSGCPFVFYNNPKQEACSTVGYCSNNVLSDSEDARLVKSCKDFIKLLYYGD